jgi:hypothetical protein
MMDEKIVSGYCRCLDAHRMVTAELEGDKWVVDCSYGNCPYEQNCPIAAVLRENGI